METAQITTIVERLEAIQKRPQMYAGEKTEKAVFALLCGFNMACEMLGYSHNEKLYWQVCEERGWEINALGPQKHMHDLGWNEEEIVDELLLLEIETWKRMLDEASSHPNSFP